MPKILTREDHIKQQYAKLYELNQRLKNISTCYYIAYDGHIYLKSLVKFTESFIALRYPESIDLFRGVMILPNKFFEFGKKAKKSKLTVKEESDKFIFGQSDNPEASFTLNIVNLYENQDDEYCKRMIIPQMYKRLFHIVDFNHDSSDESYIPYPPERFLDLPEDQVKTLVDAQPLYKEYNGTTLTLTKHLMLDIKSGDSVAFKRKCYQRIDNEECRVFYELSHETNIYLSFVIFNTLQKIKD